MNVDHMQMVKIAIEVAWPHCPDHSWRKWAQNWLDGVDRTEASAKAAFNGLDLRRQAPEDFRLEQRELLWSALCYEIALQQEIGEFASDPHNAIEVEGEEIPGVLVRPSEEDRAIVAAMIAAVEAIPMHSQV